MTVDNDGALKYLRTHYFHASETKRRRHTMAHYAWRIYACLALIWPAFANPNCNRIMYNNCLLTVIRLCLSVMKKVCARGE